MILCCGEALIDMIPAPSVTGPDGFVPHSGGAVFNTAIALGRLGARAGLLTGLSTDLFGQQLAASLRGSHVDTSAVIYSDRPTTLAFVHLNGGQASYTFYDENSAGRMIRPGDLPILPPDVDALYFGGISLCNPPGADTYLALAEREAGQRVIMLDPNIRPGFINDPATYRARLHRLIAVSDIVKVSDEDLDWIFPGPETLTEKLDKLRAEGPGIVIMTRGKEGATAVLGDDQTLRVPARITKVADTVGAGDTFNAGVMAKLAALGHLTKTALPKADPQAMEQALSFGARVAAITVSRPGANPPWMHELADSKD